MYITYIMFFPVEGDKYVNRGSQNHGEFDESLTECIIISLAHDIYGIMLDQLFHMHIED